MEMGRCNVNNEAGRTWKALKTQRGCRSCEYYTHTISTLGMCRRPKHALNVIDMPPLRNDIGSDCKDYELKDG